MLLNLIQSIIDGFATVLLTIVTVLPSSPFEGLYNLSMDEQFLGYLSWLLPIAEMLALLQAWGISVGGFYLYMIVLRWIKAIE